MNQLTHAACPSRLSPPHQAHLPTAATAAVLDGEQVLEPLALGAVQEFYRFRSSLSQWRAFHAVIACGGYAGAAEFLHVTQPAVSYSITKLEQQFGVRLLRLGGRKAQITEAGRALLAQSHELLRIAAQLEAMAMTLHDQPGSEHKRTAAASAS